MNYYLALAILLFLYMNLWFVVSLIKKRNDVADVAWGLGFILLTWGSFFFSENSGARGLVVGFLVSIWGLRLAWHINSRNRGKSEDYRYLAWRKDWGRLFYFRSYLQVYLLQGFLLFLTAIPIMEINRNNGLPLRLLDLVGVFIWIIGFYFEARGDAELAQLKKKNQPIKEKLCKVDYGRTLAIQIILVRLCFGGEFLLFPLGVLHFFILSLARLQLQF